MIGRRRKVRCIFLNDDATSCVACKRKGKVCEEQKRENFPLPAGKKTSLKDRVAKLEALLESTGNKDPDLSMSNDSRGTSDGSPQAQPLNVASTTPISSLSSSVANGEGFGQISDPQVAENNANYDPDPIVALFNNSIWQQRKRKIDDDADLGLPFTETFMNGVEQRVTAKRSHVLSLLRMSLVPPHLLRDILNVTSDWWNGWRPLGPWPREITTAARYETLQDFLLYAYNADNPPVVGLAVLCIAVSIQQLENEKHSHLIQQLPRPATELFQIYFERVDRLINTDSDFTTSKEGIECILMSAKLFEGLGLPKKSWMLFGKAIVYGQLLGLHRPYSPNDESEKERDHRYLAWSSLCQADLYLSLLLGLPYTADGKTIPASFYGESGTNKWFQRTLMSVAAKLNDRNQMGQSTSIEITQELQDELDAAAEKMPAHFWHSFECLKGLKILFIDAVDCFTHQFFYYQLRVFLHLPFMLLSIEKPHLEPHRSACLEGCRGVLQGYHLFRAECIIDVSSIVDYQAFICSSLLLLGVLGYGAFPSTFHEINQQSDRELVSRTLATLQQVSSNSNNNIATQALEGLQTLYSLISHDKCPHANKLDYRDHFAKIRIPYLGQVIISPGQFLHRELESRNDPNAVSMPTFKLSQDDACRRLAQSTDVYDANGTVSNGVESLQIDESQMPQEQMATEIASIDFDWNHLMNMNSDDWSWLADIDNNDVARFL